MAVPFSGKDANPFLEYGVETEYLPPEPTYHNADDIVPAVPDRPFAPNQQSVPPLVPKVQPQHVVNIPSKVDSPTAAQPLLHFTETTTSTHVTGTISSSSAQVPGTFGMPPALPASTSPGFGAAFSDTQQDKKYSFYNPRYYRKLYDVDTEDVLWRISNSMLGPFKSNFIDTTWDNPDLYGPFWVATTLIFVTAVSGWWGKLDRYGHDTEKQYVANQAKEISISAAVFYGYIMVIGMALYFLVRWFKGEIKLATVWCIYGYSMSVFVPVILLCTIPFEPMRWLLVMGTAFSSALFLVRNFKATISAAAPAQSFLVLLIMFLLHIGLGLTIKLYFFPLH